MEDFVDEAVSSGCSLAQHRKSNTLEVKDLKLHLGSFLLDKNHL